MSNCSQNPNGPGCRNGQLYCNDPRCYPNCTNCNTSSGGNSNWVLVTVILILLGILLILAFVIGFGWYKDRKKAGEPKNITVNRHVHTNVPPPIVVQSPAPVAVTRSTPVHSSTSIKSSSNLASSSLQQALASHGNLPSAGRISSPKISSVKLPSDNFTFTENISTRLPSKSTMSYDGTNLAGEGIPKSL